MEHDDRSRPPSPTVWVLVRLAIQVVALLLLALGVYGLALLISSDLSWVMVGWSILFVLPYAIGGLAHLGFTSPDNPEGSGVPAVLLASLCVLVVGALTLREGLICVVMLAPIWLLAAALGSISVNRLRATFKERYRLNSILLVILPFAALAVDANLPPQPDRFTVARSIAIDATPETVWPHLLQLDHLGADEGVWNITQNVLGIPRPSSAVVTGDGRGAVRAARWGENIRFEEHIIEWRASERLSWSFVFPDDSISRYTDPHIHPDGLTLKIATGAYQLRRLPDGATELRLETDYIARTPLNLYAAVWGELVLGDIQTNILAVVKDRAER